jgi:hypothetical protein
VLKEGINNLWPTPIYKTTIDQTTCDSVLNFLMTEVNLEDYLLGGENLLQVDNPVIKEFQKEVHNIFSYYFKNVLDKNLETYNASYKAWVTGKPGKYNMQVHNHSGSPFISVFYIYVQDEKESGGELILNDPRTNANRGYTEDFQYIFESLKHKPITGDVLVFPGYVYHAVNPFMSNLRIAVPVDLLLDGKEDGSDIRMED